jgi:hypothetical protein
MGEDVQVWIAKKDLPKFIENWDFDLFMWLMNQFGFMRWYRFVELMAFDDYEEKIEGEKEHYITGRTMMRYLMRSTKPKGEIRRKLSELCEKYDVIFRGDYSEKKPDKEKYVELYNVREAFEAKLMELGKG